LAGALTPKAIIWNVMQITKSHFCDLASLVVANREARQSRAAGSGGRMYCFSRNYLTSADIRRDRHKIFVVVRAEK
jgi:hypothetical protein